MKNKLRENTKIFCVKLAYIIPGKSCWILGRNCKFKACNIPEIFMVNKEIISNGIWKHVSTKVLC